MENEKKPTLKELRKAQCVSVPELCRLTDTRENTVYRWMRGDMTPTLEPAMKLARFFGLAVEDINWWPLRDSE